MGIKSTAARINDAVVSTAEGAESVRELLASESHSEHRVHGLFLCFFLDKVLLHFTDKIFVQDYF